MRAQHQSSRFKFSITSMLILSLIVLFSCSNRLVAQQKDGEETNSSSNSSTNAAPSRSAVNYSINFANLTLQNGEFLEVFGLNNSRGILRGHLAVPGTELGTTTADPLIFSTNGLERVRIHADGVFSIGTALTGQNAPFDFHTSSSATYVPQGNSPARLRLMNKDSTLNNVMEIDLGSGDTAGGVVTRIKLAAIATNQTAGQTSGDFVIGTRNLGTMFEHTRFASSGHLGVGTSAPGAKLHVVGLAPGGTAVFTGSSFSSHFNFNNDGSEDTYIRGGKPTSRVIINEINSGPVIITLGSGSVGIGTATPAAKLHVQGNARVSGNMTVDGNIAAKYQDVAEWVPAAEQLAAGTVVVLDTAKSNQVTSSSQSYDTRVAGVISAQPGITLGEKSDDKVLVATTGRVLVNVDATNGPIQIGDLLVTSEREGFAMKSVPVELGGARMHRPGTLIGKALEPLAGGTGKILVLLSLQ